MSYEQGIEKATEELDYILDVIASGGVHETKDYAAGLVEAFLSAQPTIQWCELHESVMGTEICQMADLMARRLGRNPFDKITCSEIEVRIVERRHHDQTQPTMRDRLAPRMHRPVRGDV